MTNNLYAFEIEDFDTTSTLTWALDNCSENKKERFCEQMAWTGDLDLLQFLREKGRPWDEETLLACCRIHTHKNTKTRVKEEKKIPKVD